MSLKLNQQEEIQELYVGVKKQAYALYDDFCKLSREDKLKYIENINNMPIEEGYIKDVIVATFLYPKDYLLLQLGGAKLIHNLDNVCEATMIDSGLLRTKSLEFQFFKTKKLLDEGIFKIEEMNKGSDFGDTIYQEYTKIKENHSKK